MEKTIILERNGVTNKICILCYIIPSYVVYLDKKNDGKVERFYTSPFSTIHMVLYNTRSKSCKKHGVGLDCNICK